VSLIEISSERRTGGSAQCQYEMPDDLPSCIEKFGGDVVYSHVRRSLIIALQASMRIWMDAGKSPEEIQAMASEWMPGLKKATRTPLERAREELAKMSPADRKALAAELRKAREETGAAA